MVKESDLMEGIGTGISPPLQERQSVISEPPVEKILACFCEGDGSGLSL